MIKLGTAFFIVVSAFVCAPAWAKPPEIDWSVANRYRLFDAEPALAEMAVDPGPSAQDVFLENLASARRLDGPRPEGAKYDVIRKFLGNEVQGLGPMAGKRPYQATSWLGAGPSADVFPSKARRYRTGYLYPADYTVRLQALSVSPGATCVWTAGTSTKSFPCDKRVLLPVKANRARTGSEDIQVSLVVRSPDGETASAAPVTVRVVDRLIIALGESYAAGEGNPDEPQVFPKTLKARLSEFWRERNADPYERWWRERRVLEGLTPAKWWDPVCHRSLYSQHAIASFLYAAERRREAVTFAAFSCSGTEVLDGLLTPQLKPPGIDDFGKPGKDSNFRMRAQLEDALIFLCNNNALPVRARADLTGLAVSTGITDKKRLKVIGESAAPYELDCDGDRPRKVDVVLLSVGGNDVGFSGAVKNVLLPTHAYDGIGQNILSNLRSLMRVTPVYVANRKIIYELPLLYPEVRKAIRTSLAPEGTPVIQSSYPNPLEDQGDPYLPDYRVRLFCHGADDNRLFGAMHGLFPDQKIDATRRWRLEITEQEGRDVYDALLVPLNAAVKRNHGPGWKVVEYGDAFTRRGWCAGLDGERMTYGFPGLLRDDTESSGYQWVSFDPTQWDPYEPRTRLFRTANDVALTQVGSIEPLFFSLANKSIFATSGMFHPTAQANTVTGLQVFDAMLRELPEHQ